MHNIRRKSGKYAGSRQKNHAHGEMVSRCQAGLVPPISAKNKKAVMGRGSAWFTAKNRQYLRANCKNHAEMGKIMQEFDILLPKIVRLEQKTKGNRGEEGQ